MFRQSRVLQDALRQTQVCTFVYNSSVMICFAQLLHSVHFLFLFLHNLQQDNNENVGRLIQDEPTRWQSKADSAASVLYLKDDIIEVCRWAVDELERKDIEEVSLDNNEWELLKEVQPTLGKLRHVCIHLFVFLRFFAVYVSIYPFRFRPTWKVNREF